MCWSFVWSISQSIVTRIGFFDYLFERQNIIRRSISKDDIINYKRLVFPLILLSIFFITSKRDSHLLIIAIRTYLLKKQSIGMHRWKRFYVAEKSSSYFRHVSHRFAVLIKLFISLNSKEKPQIRAIRHLFTFFRTNSPYKGKMTICMNI